MKHTRHILRTLVLAVALLAAGQSAWAQSSGSSRPVLENSCSSVRLMLATAKASPAKDSAARNLLRNIVNRSGSEGIISASAPRTVFSVAKNVTFTA